MSINLPNWLVWFGKKRFCAFDRHSLNCAALFMLRDLVHPPFPFFTWINFPPVKWFQPNSTLRVGFEYFFFLSAPPGSPCRYPLLLSASFRRSTFSYRSCLFGAQNALKARRSPNVIKPSWSKWWSVTFDNANLSICKCILNWIYWNARSVFYKMLLIVI